MIQENKKQEQIVEENNKSQSAYKDNYEDSKSDKIKTLSVPSTERIKKVSPVSYEIIPDEISYEQIGANPFKFNIPSQPDKPPAKKSDKRTKEISLDYEDISRTLVKSEKHKEMSKKTSPPIKKNEYSSIVEEALLNVDSNFTDYSDKKLPVKGKYAKKKKQEYKNNDYASIVEEALIDMQDFSSIGDQ